MEYVDIEIDCVMWTVKAMGMLVNLRDDIDHM